MSAARVKASPVFGEWTDAQLSEGMRSRVARSSAHYGALLDEVLRRRETHYDDGTRERAEALAASRRRRRATPGTSSYRRAQRARLRRAARKAPARFRVVNGATVVDTLKQHRHTYASAAIAESVASILNAPDSSTGARRRRKELTATSERARTPKAARQRAAKATPADRTLYDYCATCGYLFPRPRPVAACNSARACAKRVSK